MIIGAQVFADEDHADLFAIIMNRRSGHDICHGHAIRQTCGDRRRRACVPGTDGCQDLRPQLGMWLPAAQQAPVA